MAQRRFNQGGRRRLAVFLLQVFFQRTGIDANTDRDATITGGFHHGAHAVFTTDIARVDTQAVDAKFGYAQGDLVVEVDIGHQRHTHLLLDSAEGFGGIHIRHRDPHDVCAGIFQATNLRHGGGHIIGVAVGHALHGDRRIAAHRNRTYPYFARQATLDRRLPVHVRYHPT